MRILVALAVALPLAAAASAPAQTPGSPLDATLAQALVEQREAAASAQRLAKLAERARGRAERLKSEQAAAGEALAAAEAGITAADIRLRLASLALAEHRARLGREQRPAAALLAGLALMGRRPPLLALADKGSAEELVRVRLLIASTVPAIRARTAGLVQQVEEGRRLAAAAASARAALLTSRGEAMTRRKQFALLEQRALEAAQSAGSQSLSAGDVALAAGEDVEQLRAGQSAGRAALALAALVAAEQPAPPRPGRRDFPAKTPFAYALPAPAPVIEGVGAINASGVRARGLTLATRRGTPLGVPAAGVVRFAGPFRDYDGVVIVDHGGGWLTLIVNLAPSVGRGDRVVRGQPLGRALGPIEVELSHNGQVLSPALIAG